MADLTLPKAPEPYSKPYKMRVPVEVPEMPGDADMYSLLKLVGTHQTQPASIEFILNEELNSAGFNVKTVTVAAVSGTITLDSDTERTLIQNELSMAFKDKPDEFDWEYRVYDALGNLTYTMEASYRRILDKTVSNDGMDTYYVIDPLGDFKVVRPITDSTTWEEVE
jgi:hypothetical protein